MYGDNDNHKENEHDSDSSYDSSDDDADENGDVSSKVKKAPPQAGSTSGHIKNCPMLLITCDAGKEQLCKKEMLAWLIDSADRLYPRAPFVPPAASSATSVSSGLAAELAALQAESAASASSSAESAKSAKALGVRFKVVPDMNMFRGIVLIAILDSALPLVSLVESMLGECRSSQQFRTRYSVHLHPFEMTSYSEMESVFKMADSIVPKSFDDILLSSDPALQAKRTFSVEWIRRGCNTKMDRMKVIDHLAKLVPKKEEGKDGFTVDLKNPEIVILVETLGVRTTIKHAALAADTATGSEGDTKYSSEPHSKRIAKLSSCAVRSFSFSLFFQRTTGLSVLTNYFAHLKFNIRTLFEQVLGFKQEAEVKSPADQAAAKAAAVEKKKKIQEEHLEREAARKAKAPAAAAAAPTSISAATEATPNTETPQTTQ